MSADNWTTCPKCKADKEKDQHAKMMKASAAYGKVSADEFMKMNAAATAPIKMGQQLREDYEIGIDECGDFEINYHASCSGCGFKYSFKHSVAAFQEGGAS